MAQKRHGRSLCIVYSIASFVHYVIHATLCQWYRKGPSAWLYYLKRLKLICTKLFESYSRWLFSRRKTGLPVPIHCPFYGDKFPFKRAIRTPRRLPTPASDSWRHQAYFAQKTCRCRDNLVRLSKADVQMVTITQLLHGARTPFHG